jgi:hypothetical protein
MSGTQVQKVRSVGVFSASSRSASVICPVLPSGLSVGVQPLSANAAAVASEVIATAALRALCLMIALLSLVVM